MSKKSNEPGSYLPAESGGAAPAQSARKKPARAKAAAAATGGASRASVSKDVVSTDSTRQTSPSSITAAAAETPRASASNGAETPRTHAVSDQEEIARLAHSYWEARGQTGGSAEEDWIRAEQEYQRRR